LALPLSTIRIKGAGSDAGHNGLKDIQQVLGNDKYAKLRFGIGNDFPKGAQAHFVLSKWKQDELETVKKKIMLSVEAVESFILQGLQPTMNAFNKMIIENNS
jgi:peptidyl-tRNA hydrolase, PTH1 family